MAVLNLRGRFASVASPMKRSAISWICGVGSMISSAAMPADGGAEDDPRHVAAGLGGAEPDLFQSTPDLRDVFDLHPVQLHVLAIGEVGGVAGELGRDLADHPELLRGELPAVDAHAQHEVLVLELVRLELGGAAAVDARLALGVQPPPAEASVQVGRVDRRESALRVDRLDALPHVEPVVCELELLVRVQGSRPSTAHCPWGLVGVRVVRVRAPRIGVGCSMVMSCSLGWLRIKVGAWTRCKNLDDTGRQGRHRETHGRRNIDRGPVGPDQAICGTVSSYRETTMSISGSGTVPPSSSGSVSTRPAACRSARSKK